MEFMDRDRQSWVDLTPYMHRDPISLYTYSRASHVYRVFRTLGLRHLLILSRNFEVAGIVTRKCLQRGNIQTIMKKKNDSDKEKQKSNL